MSVALAGSVLWLSVIGLGVAFGAGLYEHRIVLPRWIVDRPGTGVRWNAATAREDDTGRRFWAFVTTAPLTLLTLASLAVAWQWTGPGRGWWLAGASLAAVERGVTFTYFIPVMVRLMRQTDGPEARRTAVRWRRANLIRHGLVFAAWVLLLQAFAVTCGVSRFVGSSPPDRSALQLLVQPLLERGDSPIASIRASLGSL